ncbi:hypothetical protein R6Z07M_019023 [Ovis aries]
MVQGVTEESRRRQDKFLLRFPRRPKERPGILQLRQEEGCAWSRREEPRGVSRDLDCQYFQLLPGKALTGLKAPEKKNTVSH